MRALSVAFPAVLLVGALLLPSVAAADTSSDRYWRPVLIERAEQEMIPLAALSAGFGGAATTAHIGAPFRAHYAPQVGFTTAGLASFHLLQLAAVGSVRAGLGRGFTAKELRFMARGAAWTIGVTSGFVTIGFGVFALTVAGWSDPSWSFAVMNVPLGMIVATVTLSVWADRLHRATKGEDPLLTRRGRPRPEVIVGPGAVVVRW